MLIRSLPIVTEFIDAIDKTLSSIKSSARLSLFQKAGLTIILMGIFVTGQLNWDAFERSSLKRAKSGNLRWLFYHAKISWEYLLQASIRNILQHYRLTEGVLSLDDTDKKRAKKNNQDCLRT